MSFLIAGPQALAAAAGDLAGIGTALSQAGAVAAAPTMSLLAPGADEISAALTSIFGAHAQNYQSLSAQAEQFHTQFVQSLNSAGLSYATAEAASVKSIEQDLNAINAPTPGLLGRPLIGSGNNGGTLNGLGQAGGAGGVLRGNGVNGANSTATGATGRAGGAAALLGNGGRGGNGGAAGIGGGGGIAERPKTHRHPSSTGSKAGKAAVAVPAATAPTVPETPFVRPTRGLC